MLSLKTQSITTIYPKHMYTHIYIKQFIFLINKKSQQKSITKLPFSVAARSENDYRLF